MAELSGYPETRADESQSLGLQELNQRWLVSEPAEVFSLVRLSLVHFEEGNFLTIFQEGSTRKPPGF